MQISGDDKTAGSACERKLKSSLLITAHAWFHEQIGGSLKIATELAEYLASEGHRVVYVCGTEEPRPSNPTIENGVELWRYPFPKARSPHPANGLGHVMGTYRLTRRILRRGPVACVNGHTPLQFLGASLAARRRCRHRVYTVHSPFAEELDCGWDGLPKSLRRRIAVLAAGAIDGFNYRAATTIQCMSRFTAELLASHHGTAVAKKTVVTPGWVDIERFRPVDDVPATRAALGGAWRTDLPVFLTVRRLEARMGLGQLIDAARILSEQPFRFRVLIGGTGSLEQELGQRIRDAGLEDTVYLLGRVSDHDLPLCFAAADCFVLPTRALECFGLIILEAYASGTPVIATPVGAIPELVAKQGAQWLTSGTEAGHVAERMAAFLRGDLRSNPAGLRAFAEGWGAEAGLRSHAEVVLACPMC